MAALMHVHVGANRSIWVCMHIYGHNVYAYICIWVQKCIWLIDARVSLTVYSLIYPTLCTRRLRHKVNFKRTFPHENLEFSFSYTGWHNKFKDPSETSYLLLASRRIFGFIVFPSLLSLCEIQTASFRIWTRVITIWVRMCIGVVHVYVYACKCKPICVCVCVA